MRYSSSLAVGSPTARVLAILAATLLLVALVTAAGAGAARLLAAEDGDLIVDASGGGTHTAIADALADSEDGDIILVRPGTYAEALLIDKDITLTGDGPVDEIFISAPADGPFFGDPEWDGHYYAVLLEGSEADLSDLTLRGDGSTLVANGGAPVLSGLVFDHVNEPEYADDANPAVLFVGDSTGTLRDSTFIASDDVLVRDSAPMIEGNTLSGGSSIWGAMGNETVIRGNHIDGSLGAGIFLQEQTEALIEGNTVTNALSEAGIWVTGDGPVPVMDQASDPEPTIRGNTITGSGDVPGIFILPRIGGSVTDNFIEVAGTGISVGKDSTTVISGNRICAGVAAIEVEEPNEVDIGENELCDVG